MKGEAERGGGGEGTPDENKARAWRGRHSGQRRLQPPPTANPLLKDLACILPLYEWLSLGDGGIGAVETAIRNRSISGLTSNICSNRGCGGGGDGHTEKLCCWVDLYSEYYSPKTILQVLPLAY